MKAFGGTTEQEKAMSLLIHDTNQALSELNYHLGELKKSIVEHHRGLPEDLKKSFSSVPYVHMAYLDGKGIAMRKALDEYIKKFQNDFQP